MSKIKTNLEINVGKPTIDGTRITVATILNLTRNGYSVNDIIKAYPVLKREDITASFDFAQGIIEREEVLPNNIKFSFA